MVWLGLFWYSGITKNEDIELKTNNTIDSIQQEIEMSETKIDMDNYNGTIIFIQIKIIL
jgi:uncharacterized protein YdgA (DUF945 family)